MTSADPARLSLLVLGGTSWLGGAVARDALAAGHEVTCLARGEAGTPPSRATWVRADRRAPGAYDEVAGHDWDAVLDVSWQPDLVRSALSALGARARHWVYVSSASVYDDDSTPGCDESASTHEPYPEPGPVDAEAYGPAKVACENACLQLGADRVLLARAGLIVGYGDRSDRMGYWPARAARAGADEPVLVPPLDAPAQVVDVDDLSAWLVWCCESATCGTYNVNGDQTTVRALVEASAGAAGTSPAYVEATDRWLTEQEVQPWSGPESLPMWLPQPDYAGFMTRSNAAAKGAGLRLRPLADSVEAALRWERERGLDRDRQAGLTPSRERELLDRLLR
jgi:nucleoside-diphosphate-sugar epimerase